MINSSEEAFPTPHIFNYYYSYQYDPFYLIKTEIDNPRHYTVPLKFDDETSTPSWIPKYSSLKYTAPSFKTLNDDEDSNAFSPYPTEYGGYKLLIWNIAQYCQPKKIKDGMPLIDCLLYIQGLGRNEDFQYEDIDRREISASDLAHTFKSDLDLLYLYPFFDMSYQCFQVYNEISATFCNKLTVENLNKWEKNYRYSTPSDRKQLCPFSDYVTCYWKDLGMDFKNWKISDSSLEQKKWGTKSDLLGPMFGSTLEATQISHRNPWSYPKLDLNKSLLKWNLNTGWNCPFINRLSTNLYRNKRVIFKKGIVPNNRAIPLCWSAIGGTANGTESATESLISDMSLSKRMNTILFPVDRLNKIGYPLDVFLFNDGLFPKWDYLSNSNIRPGPYRKDIHESMSKEYLSSMWMIPPVPNGFKGKTLSADAEIMNQVTFEQRMKQFCESNCRQLIDPRLKGGGHCYNDSSRPCYPFGYLAGDTNAEEHRELKASSDRTELFSTCSFGDMSSYDHDWERMTNAIKYEVNRVPWSETCLYGDEHHPYNSVYDCVNLWTLMLCDYQCVDTFGRPVDCFITEYANGRYSNPYDRSYNASSSTITSTTTVSFVTVTSIQEENSDEVPIIDATKPVSYILKFATAFLTSMFLLLLNCFDVGDNMLNTLDPDNEDVVHVHKDLQSKGHKRTSNMEFEGGFRREKIQRKWINNFFYDADVPPNYEFHLVSTVGQSSIDSPSIKSYARWSIPAGYQIDEIEHRNDEVVEDSSVEIITVENREGDLISLDNSSS